MRTVLIWTWTATGAAWLALSSWAFSAAAPALSHASATGPLGALTMSAGWLLMTLAMMLPLSARLLTGVARLVDRRPDRNRLVTLAATGVVLPWIIVGQALQLADLVAHQALDGRLDGSRFVLGCVVAAAGGMQFSGLKRRCLSGCRSPAGFAARLWRGNRPSWTALHIGAAYGASCVGCCAALMVVAFAIGMAAVLPMLGLAVLMAAERWLPQGERVAVVGGVGLVVTGLVLLLVP